MGKRKRGAVVRTEIARRLMQAYWEKKRATGVAFIATVGFPSTTKSATTRNRMDKARISPRQPAKKRNTRKSPLSADYQPGGFES